MPGNSFIHFGTTDVKKGESLQDVRKGDDGWIEISDWSWQVEAEHSNLKGSGASVGKPSPQQLTFTHTFDLSSPTIMKKIIEGKHFDLVKIDMLKQTGGDKADHFFQIVMSNVFITKVQTKGGEDGSVNQDVDMVFKEVCIGYKAQSNKGTLEDTVFQFDWNIAQMNLKTTQSVSIK